MSYIIKIKHDSGKYEYIRDYVAISENNYDSKQYFHIELKNIQSM